MKLREMSMPGDQQYLFIGTLKFYLTLYLINNNYVLDLNSTSNLPDNMMIRSRIMPMQDEIIRPIFFLKTE